MKAGWKKIPFEKSIEKVKYTTKIATCDYCEEGVYPIISQESEYISGYWNNSEDVFKISKPVVIFGEHTRIFKYIDFDFVLGADGVKILQPIDDLNAKFFKFYLEFCNIPNLGYSRHYKLLKELEVPIPSDSEQEQIVAELDLISRIIEKKQQQLKELESLAQSLFYEMFGNPVENDKGWEKIPFEKSIEKVKYTTKIPSCNYCGEGMFPIISQEDEYISGYWDNSDDVFKISKPIVIFGDHTRILKYIDFDFVLGADGVKVLQPVDSINARFFKFYLELSKIPSLGYSRHYKLLKELNVFTPPLPLQQEFASNIEKIEKQKELIKQSLQETETLFNSRMDFYFN